MNFYVTIMKSNEYHCIDCVACEDVDDPEQTVYKCKFDNQNLVFDVETKTPCKRFMPEDYIKAINYDTR